MGGISERMLSQVLKDLESDGFVLRTAHPVVPPHVDYELTALGQAAAERLIGLVGWIESELDTILAAGAGSDARLAENGGEEPPELDSATLL